MIRYGFAVPLWIFPVKLENRHSERFSWETASSRALHSPFSRSCRLGLADVWAAYSSGLVATFGGFPLQ
jgi:hypothetical protein